jgi:hypothetical protein
MRCPGCAACVDSPATFVVGISDERRGNVISTFCECCADDAQATVVRDFGGTVANAVH